MHHVFSLHFEDWTHAKNLSYSEWQHKLTCFAKQDRDVLRTIEWGNDGKINLFMKEPLGSLLPVKLGIE